MYIEDNLQESVLSSTRWALKSKRRSSGLRASAFPHRAVCFFLEFQGYNLGPCVLNSLQTEPPPAPDLPYIGALSLVEDRWNREEGWTGEEA